MKTLEEIYADLNEIINELNIDIKNIIKQDNPTKVFYEKFQKVCYGKDRSWGALRYIAELLSLELVEANDKCVSDKYNSSIKGDYGFWINYAPHEDSKLNTESGRLVNQKESAYIKLSEQNEVIVIAKDDKKDVITHYFNTLINKESIDKGDIIALQETLGANPNIKCIYADTYMRDDAQCLYLKIRKSDGISYELFEHKTINEEDYFTSDLKSLFGNAKKYKGYKNYLSKIFLCSNTSNDNDYAGKSRFLPKSFTVFNLTDSAFDFYSGTIVIGASIELYYNATAISLYQVKGWMQALAKLEIVFFDSLKKEKIKRESIKSAKAAIMSRNMSHNLGSHVMAYLKQHLSSVQEIISNRLLSELLCDCDASNAKQVYEKLNQVCIKGLKVGDNKKNTDTESNKELEIALPFLVGIGRFISYLQERQDFIATIATDYVPYYAAVNFKDFVYDELNPDLRHLRHKERSGMQPDNILLGNIARSEGLARETCPTAKGNKGDQTNNQLYDIVLSFRGFDGRCTDGNESRIAALNQMRECEFCLPGGVVGRQAIFSIVENIIRNAAKHGQWRDSPSRNLELKFDVFKSEDFAEDSEKDQERIGLFRPIFEKYYKNAIGIKDLYIVTITDNLKLGNNCAKMIDTLRNAITEPYINESAEMLNTNKGIKEMRISAAWLRSIDDQVDIHPYKIVDDRCKGGEYGENQYIWDANGKSAPVLLANIVDNSLQYSFCVLRQKKVLIITDEDNKKKLVEHINDNAWGVMTFEEYKREETNKSYEFIVVDTEKFDANPSLAVDEFNNLRRISHNRIYKLKDINGFADVVLQPGKLDCEKIYELLHKKLVLFEKGEKITISDDKTLDKYQKLNNVSSKELNITDNLVIGDGILGEYIYKKHFDTKDNFESFMSSGAECAFVESITGNNSTDRLIRNENIDILWACRHMKAMKAKVAIFDERLFSKIFKIEESSLIPITETAETIIPSNTKGKSMITHLIKISEKYKFLGELLGSNKELPMKIFGEKSGLSDDERLEEMRKLVRENIGRFNKDNSLPPYHNADYISIVYHLKGVDIFNVIKVEGRLDIYSYSGYGVDESCGYYGKCVKIGSINKEKNNGRYVIDRVVNKEMTKAYDYISIHQGLLDKIYELLDIKNNAKEKFLFLRDFYNVFTILQPEGEIKNNDKIIEYNDKTVCGDDQFVCSYLPQMYIHSGRSKPAFADMPQKQPFIQYAAIEHAVIDCKYSLINLFDYARYE